MIALDYSSSTVQSVHSAEETSLYSSSRGTLRRVSLQDGEYDPGVDNRPARAFTASVRFCFTKKKGSAPDDDDHLLEFYYHRRMYDRNSTTFSHNNECRLHHDGPLGSSPIYYHQKLSVVCLLPSMLKNLIFLKSFL